MTVREITNKESWEKFLSVAEETTFLQSWVWGEVQKSLGEQVVRMGVFIGEELIAVSQAIKIKARRGAFFLLPHGPVLKNSVTVSARKEVLNALVEHLKSIAKVDFIRVACAWDRTEENNKIFRELGFRRAPLFVHPELTWEVDVTQSEEKLLSAMRKTTRYLIKKMPEKGITVRKATDAKGLDLFWKLYIDTAKRQGFVPFSKKFLEEEVAHLSMERNVEIFLSFFDGKVISGGVFVYWNGIGFYHHGASDSNYAKYSPAYPLLWEAIKEAKSRGCKIFNFWGVVEDDEQSHPWRGLSQFKKGYGGAAKRYVFTQDLPLTSKYWLNFFVEKIRRAKRRY